MNSPEDPRWDWPGAEKRLGRTLKYWVNGFTPPRTARDHMLEKALSQALRTATSTFWQQSIVRLDRKLTSSVDLLQQIGRALFVGNLLNMPGGLYTNSISMSFHHYPLPVWVLCT